MTKKTPEEVAAAMQSYVTTDYRHHPIDEATSFVINFDVLLLNGETWSREVINPLTLFQDGFFDQAPEVISDAIWDMCIAEEPNGSCFSNDLVAENDKAPIVRTPQSVIKAEEEDKATLAKRTVIYTP